MPKTGGTSIRSFLQRRSIKAINRRHNQYCSKHKLVKSYGASVLNGYSVCFLRDPIKHTESIYSYIRNNKNHKNHEMAKKCSFEEFIIKNKKVHNYFCKYLSCRGTNDFDVEEALCNIKEIDYVGFTESLSKDMSRIVSLLGYDFSYDNSIHKLKSEDFGLQKKRVKASNKIKKIIRDIRKDDYLVYELAQKIYNKKWP